MQFYFCFSHEDITLWQTNPGESTEKNKNKNQTKAVQTSEQMDAQSRKTERLKRVERTNQDDEQNWRNQKTKRILSDTS